MMAPKFFLFIILVMLSLCSTTQQMVNLSEINTTKNPIQNQPPPVNVTVPQDDAYIKIWNQIIVNNTEYVCLKEAKKAAGSDAWAVKSCNCQQTNASGELKTFNCNINTLDPTTNYYANIGCSLPDKDCTIDTNAGSYVLTFDYLSQEYGIN